jgi:hypothetical protein
MGIEHGHESRMEHSGRVELHLISSRIDILRSREWLEIVHQRTNYRGLWDQDGTIPQQPTLQSTIAASCISVNESFYAHQRRLLMHVDDERT